MEARFVNCRSFQQLKPPEKSLAPSPPIVKGLLSRFGSQAQALFAPKKQRFGSSVAIHKLRETKWFKHDEQNILCAVLESGFILEVKAEDPLPADSTLSPEYHMYAVAMWKKGKGKLWSSNFWREKSAQGLSSALYCYGCLWYPCLVEK